MTTTEHSVIERLRDELHQYHVDVHAHIERDEVRWKDVSKMILDMYGEPGHSNTSPGLMGDVADLKRSRRNVVWAIRVVWGTILAFMGAIATVVVRSRG